jgi:hypothetical protein
MEEIETFYSIFRKLRNKEAYLRLLYLYSFGNFYSSFFEDEQILYSEESFINLISLV